MTTNHEPVPPLVCTLTPAELSERDLQWGDLAELSLSIVSIDNGVASTYPIEFAAAVEELADRESTCCGSWLSTATSRSDEVVHLELTTKNPDGVALIASILAPEQ